MNRPSRLQRATRSQGWTGAAAVAATYIHFLLFAQYGLVRLITARGGAASDVDRVMAVMGLVGLVASLGTAFLLARAEGLRLVRRGFLLCAAGALLALAPGAAGREGAAALTGLGLGLLTVSLSASLRRLMPGPHFGLMAGSATGLAYLVCNLPPLFDGPPVLQTLFCAAVCLLGLTATSLHARAQRTETPDTPAAAPGLQRDDFRSWGFASIVLGLLALVWLDSTAFATIQHSHGMRGRTWGGPALQLEQGAIHILAAMAAGWLADRGWYRGLLVGAFLLFALAFRMLAVWGMDAMAAGPLYAVGISAYSVALILFPSARPDEPGLVPARWRAALLYGVAGWLGSALGVGMGQHLDRIPAALVAVAGLILAGGLALAHAAWWRRAWRGAGIVLLMGAAALLYYARAAGPDAAPALTDADRGRLVYREEGCIHCHSQFIRPRTRDVERWGPAAAVAADERPPLIGNRRQGPDLRNVGIRRSAEWQRLHLMDPGALSPGSRMPSYAHLFEEGATRGEDLVAYLGSLGQDRFLDRAALVQSWQPDEDVPPGVAARGAAVFARFCTPCHGSEGRGDGPQAQRVARPAMNLRKGAFWYAGAAATPGEKSVALQRIVRFGVAGTSMPGHEAFDDQRVADVAAFLLELTAQDTPDPAGKDP